MADVYFAYGKALLENAIAQNSVLGKEEKEGAAEPEGNVAHNKLFLQPPRRFD
jgi:HAT1-interacting factor 1